MRNIIEKINSTRNYLIDLISNRYTTTNTQLIEYQEVYEEQQVNKRTRKYRSNGDTCRKCNKIGHYARNCPTLTEEEQNITKQRQREKDQRQTKVKLPQLENNTQRIYPRKNNRKLIHKGITCFICEEEGHYANECPNKRTIRKTVTCFKCREDGHYANQCPNTNTQNNRRTNRKTVICFTCGEENHYSSQCPTGNNSNKRRRNKKNFNYLTDN